MYTPCVDEAICVAVIQTTSTTKRLPKKKKTPQQMIFKGKFTKKQYSNMHVLLKLRSTVTLTSSKLKQKCKPTEACIKSK